MVAVLIILFSEKTFKTVLVLAKLIFQKCDRQPSLAKSAFKNNKVNKIKQIFIEFYDVQFRKVLYFHSNHWQKGYRIENNNKVCEFKWAIFERSFQLQTARKELSEYFFHCKGEKGSGSRSNESIDEISGVQNFFNSQATL